MNKLARLIEKMPYTELVSLQKDLRGGNLDRQLDKRLEQIRPTKAAYCPVCNGPIDPDRNMTLVFGPPYLRQKASFDGKDCLVHFLGRLEDQEHQDEEPPP